jgi:D-arabinose 5-phosphate isomerase GutQ
VANPGAQNAGQCLGITQASQGTAGAAVPVRRLGISAFVGHGTITRGDHLAIYSSAGDLYSVETAVAAGLASPAAVINVVGTAECSLATSGDIGYVFIAPQVIALAVS